CYELLLILAETQAHQPEALARGHVEEALRTLDRAVHQLGAPTQAYFVRRTRYLQQLGKLVEARTEREHAAACLPGSPLDHFLLGDDQQRQGNVTVAIRHFEEALRLQPDHFWARYFLAVCYLREANRTAQESRPTLVRAETNAARECFTVCIGARPDVAW